MTAAVAEGGPAGQGVSRLEEEAQVADDPKKDLGGKLTEIFNQLREVRVFTIVDDVLVTVSTEAERTKASFDPLNKQVPALITIFNLLDGDVVNVVPPTLEADTELRAFHAAQVEKSLAVLPANIEALVKLGKAIIDEFT